MLHEDYHDSGKLAVLFLQTIYQLLTILCFDTNSSTTDIIFISNDFLIL